ncbi:MAG: hypothetical protein QT00_C0002G0148 [archaeon GW2011_AR5]|nr:MAG: hypothetical protein QT00_C0002G0148 [archaeon GW2011_AR5]
MDSVAYFTAEIGLKDDIPTYSGGLGALAGDTVRSVADMNFERFPYNFAAVSLLYPEGYFTQSISDGRQHEHYPRWCPADKGLVLQREKVRMALHDREVEIGAWRYDVRGRGRTVPVYLLDTSEISGCSNSEWDRKITLRLYSGGVYERLVQEAVLGIGGTRMLEAVGYDATKFHLNEGHAAFAVAERLKRCGDVAKVRENTIFTTHSPVAGHDGFDYALIHQVFNGTMPNNIHELAGCNYLNMTQLALNGSSRTNAVSRKHGQVSSRMFGRNIGYVTNGVHHATWASDAFRRLYDEELPGWRDDPSILSRAGDVDGTKIAAARNESKTEAARYLREVHGIHIDPSRPVITWARRFDGSYSHEGRLSSYKRPLLLFHDMNRLRAVLERSGAQLLYAGKAHPNNTAAKDEISRVVWHLGELKGAGINTAFVPNYNMETCRHLTAGSDIWLNTPRVPLEASGTSGMCAAMNGVPQAGTMDGWWVEGFNGRNGWMVGSEFSDDDTDSGGLYSIIEGFGTENAMSVGAIQTGATFNTHRMVNEYARNLYF